MTTCEVRLILYKVLYSCKEKKKQMPFKLQALSVTKRTHKLAPLCVLGGGGREPSVTNSHERTKGTNQLINSGTFGFSQAVDLFRC